MRPARAALGRRRRGRLLAGAAAIALAAPAPGVEAQVLPQFEAPPRDAPALLTAEEVRFDQELGIVTAVGNVEITQGNRVLRADQVSYNQRQNVVTATGSVSVLEPTGDVLFADYVELSDELKDGVIQNLRLRLADHSRLAAVSGRRAGGTVTAMRKVVYSPCEPCANDPDAAPVWQIKAAKVTHDQSDGTITYNDAWMELFGVPVAYTPYFSHPDGSVKRKSGFLAPGFWSSSKIGQVLATPYYWALDTDKDLTVEPIFLTKDRPVLAMEYRQRFGSGPLSMAIAATPAERRSEDGLREPGTQLRGFVKGAGRFDIDDDWRWGFDVQRATDDTFIQRYKLRQRYGFFSSTTLTSHLFAEGFRGRNYMSANSYAFQGLRPQDRSGLEPIVLPMLDYRYIGEPGAYGGRFSFDANALSVHRSEGTRTQRVAVKGGWALPHIASTGEVYSLEATVEGDIHNVSHLGDASDPFRTPETGARARLFPQVTLGWRYPWLNRGETFRTIIEPRFSLVAAPKLGDQERLPNEDSRSVDLDDISLFRPNRFTGIDRLEGGQRINYGLGVDIGRYYGGRGSVFIGHSYRFQRESAFPQGSGLEGHSSNIVGRLNFAPHPWFAANYRFQLDREDFKPVRSEAGIGVGPSAFRIGVSHLLIDQKTTPLLTQSLEQVATSATIRLTEHWRIQGRTLNSLAEADKGLLVAAAGAIYEDECLIAGVEFIRRNVGNRDNPSDTALVLRLIFRNLGELRTGIL